VFVQEHVALFFGLRYLGSEERPRLLLLTAFFREWDGMWQIPL